MTLFRDKELIHDPKVLIRIQDKGKNDFSFSVKQLEGAFYRVIPSNVKEIAFIQGLKKNVFVYVPVEGDGLIITLNLF